MNQIRPWLFIGNYRDTNDLYMLSTNHIQAMLQLGELVRQPSIVSLYLAVDDANPLSTDLLQQGVEFVKTNKNAGHTTLVACGAGISRAAAFAIAILKEIEGIGLSEAYREVKQYHDDMMPHPVLWQSLCDYYNEEIPFFDLLVQ